MSTNKGQKIACKGQALKIVNTICCVVAFEGNSPYDELKHWYEESIRGIDVQFPDFDELLDMLLKRKLIIKGMGYTGMDALFNMLYDAFVIPYSVPIPKKAWTLLRLIAQGKLRVMELIHLQRKHCGTADEERVIRLIEQTPLSTAELIRCFERGIYDVSTPEKVIDGLYSSKSLNELLPMYGISRSMSRVGTPTDNAAMEAINGWVKAELFMDLYLTGDRPVQEEVDDYIVFFSELRPAYSLNYLTPKQYRESFSACPSV